MFPGDPSGWESTCQHKGHRFDPWSKRIPHAKRQLTHNYCAWALELVSCNYWAHGPQVLKPAHPRACALQQKKPLQWEAHSPQLESSPCTTREVPTTTRESQRKSKEDPAQPKNKKYLSCPARSPGLQPTTFKRVSKYYCSGENKYHSKCGSCVIILVTFGSDVLFS